MESIVWDDMDFFIGKRSEKIEKKAPHFGLKILFAKEISKVEELKDIKQEIEDYDAIIIKTHTPEMMRRLIDKAVNYFKIIIILGTNDSINRACLENSKTTILLSPEHDRKKDFINYRNSGLNQVLCKIAKENRKIIVEDFSKLDRMDKKAKSIVLGKIIQNAKLCKKYDVQFFIKNMARSEQEISNYPELRNLQRVLLSSP